MLDEPMGALDRALRERLMLDVRAILKRVGMTAIYVTHDQTEAFAVADQLAVMNAGLIEQLGWPPAVYERPATPFVARFLGFENLLPGRVDASGLIITAVGRFRPLLPAHGPAVTLLVKPALDRSAAPEGDTAEAVNVIDAVVEAVAFRGRFCQVWLVAGGARLLMWLVAGGARLLFEVADADGYRLGEPVRIRVAPEQLLVYEATGGVHPSRV